MADERACAVPEGPPEWVDIEDDSGALPGSADQKVTKWDLRKINTRRMILQAGREVFAERGYDAPKVEDVARAAGISRAAFYLHFKSLDELLEAIFRREMRWQLRRYQTLSWAILQDRDKTRAWIEGFCQSFRQERRYVLIMYRACSVDPANLQVVNQEHERVIAGLARRIPQLGLVGADGAPDLSRVTRFFAAIRLLEDVALYGAFDCWGASTEVALDLIIDQFHAIARGGD